ncbi:MAG: AMP-binding protein [Clostridia bacterium]|nr:AMP-binding protein [Clostridia bacterium]
MNKNAPFYETYPITDFRDIVKKRLEKFPDVPVFRQKPSKGGDYVDIYPKQLDRDVDELGTGLRSLLPHGSRVAIIGETRYEWYVSYFATTNGVGCVVPLDKELMADEIINMCDRAVVDAIIFSSSKKPLIDEIYKKSPSVKYYICMDDTSNENYMNYSEVKSKGAKLLDEGNRDFIDAVIDPEIMSILLFTSGTTSKSKAVMLCQRNICQNCEQMFEYVNITEKDSFLSVLPLHHTYECTCGFIAMVYHGSTIAVCEGLRYITQNLKEAKPSIVLMVPAMLTMFYKTIQKKINGDPKLAKKFNFGLKLTGLLLKCGIDIRKKIFSDIHETFGGNIRLLIVGGAPIDPDVMTFFQKIGIQVLQGYGLTECSPILALNRDVFYKNHSAGIPLRRMDVRIDSPDEDGIGEIIAKGPCIFLGYYGDDEATKAVMDSNGYYHTGDLGYIDEDGFVIITGRKKNVIIASNGKNVFPEEIEYILGLDSCVAESVVSGIHDEVKNDIIIVATIYPDMDNVKAKLGDNPSEEEIQKLLESIASKANEKLTSYKKIKKVVYRPTEFEKNTSKKIKRY